MATGLSRKEHYALLGLIALLLGGWGLNIYRAHRAGSVYVEGQGRWEKVADFKATARDDVAGPEAKIPAAKVAVGEAAGNALGETGLDLNAATFEDLDQLPGLGPVKVQAILDAREQRGGFRALNELCEVDGIGPKTLERLRLYFKPLKVAEHLTTSTASLMEPDSATGATQPAVLAKPAGPININSADITMLKEIKGIGDALALRIVEDRRVNGPYWKAEDLQRVKGVGPKTFEKMRPMICVQ